MQNNWVEIAGDYVTIKDDVITYSPPPKTSDVKELGIPTKVRSRKSMIRSSVTFENGVIEFYFKVSKPAAVITVGLNNDSTLIGTNSKVSKSLYSIREFDENNKIEVLDSAGVFGKLKIDQEYKFKVEVNGSEIVVYINDVIVVSTASKVSKSPIALGFLSNGDIEVRKFTVKTKRPNAFIVMQFTNEYNELYNDVIRPVCESYGYECIRADEFYHSSLILNDIIDSIKKSSVIIADITPDNPNVFYEVGYAHALAKPTILLSDKKREKLPFDVSGFRTLFYDNTIGGKSKVEENLKKHLEHLNK